ncbi:hypothetical protein [Muricoccus vinaceus]|uniref:Uncharacterized protein n=1 Tax=Muricoccus vinaceus TaxID=424704 RepID=A0ABV6IMX6_9PROT
MMPLRVLLVAAGAIAGLVAAEDAENFAVIQGMVALGLIALLVAVLALLDRK